MRLLFPAMPNSTNIGQIDKGKGQPVYGMLEPVQIIHKGAHLCPVSETEEKGLWAQKFHAYKQSKQGETKENTSHKSCDEPWKEGAEVITKKGVHKQNKSA